MDTRLPFEKLETDILVKKEAHTDVRYGKSPEQRTTKELLNYGVICLNKLEGPSSHQTSDYVKQVIKVSKAGHGGSLDPNVTGVLPIALENATKVMQTLLTAGKEYVCLMYIHKELPEEKIKSILNSFVGRITQLPPIRSAVKREYRQRNIYYLEIIDIKEKDVLFKVGCEAGTYIRRLCDDFGKKAGFGAHMKQLVRTKAGPFRQEDWCSLHDLKDAFYLYEKGDDTELRKLIRPAEFAVGHLQKIWVTDTTVDTLSHGANLSMPGIAKLHASIKKGDLIAIFTLKEELICLGNAKLEAKEIIEKDKGIAVITTKVFMEANIYPKFKKVN